MALEGKISVHGLGELDLVLSGHVVAIALRCSLCAGTAVVGQVAKMAVGAGLVEISPKLIFKGVFLCLVGGALLLIIRAYVAAPVELDDQAAADANGSK